MLPLEGQSSHTSTSGWAHRASLSLSSCMVSKETWYWDASNVTEMVLSGVRCAGHEMTLSHCQHDSRVSCRKTGTRFAAGVICSESKSVWDAFFPICGFCGLARAQHHRPASLSCQDRQGTPHAAFSQIPPDLLDRHRTS